MKIKTYAILKDYFEPELEVSKDMTNVSALKQELICINPSAKAILDLSRFAVENTFVGLDFMLKGKDEVLIIPPSSGG